MIDKKPRQRMTISLTKEALEGIESSTSQNDVSVARVIRYTVDNFLKE